MVTKTLGENTQLLGWFRLPFGLSFEKGLIALIEKHVPRQCVYLLKSLFLISLGWICA